MNDFLEFLYAHIPHRWLNKKAKGTKKLFKGLAKNVNYIYDFVTMIDLMIWSLGEKEYLLKFVCRTALLQKDNLFLYWK